VARIDLSKMTDQLASLKVNARRQLHATPTGELNDMLAHDYTGLVMDTLHDRALNDNDNDNR
jgi:hypothetical protein